MDTFSSLVFRYSSSPRAINLKFCPALNHPPKKHSCDAHVHAILFNITVKHWRENAGTIE